MLVIKDGEIEISENIGTEIGAVKMNVYAFIADCPCNRTLATSVTLQYFLELSLAVVVKGIFTLARLLKRLLKGARLSAGIGGELQELGEVELYFYGHGIKPLQKLVLHSVFEMHGFDAL